MNILELIGVVNIAENLDIDDLNKIGDTVVEEYDIDKDSREDWEKTNAEAMKLATQIIEQKNKPFKGAANIKYPTLSMAAVQFGARAYSQLINSGNIVKAKVVGSDPQGMKASVAGRVSQHMNYQLTQQMPNWEEDTDSLLIALPIEGCEFKKSYFDSAFGTNVSEWVRPDEMVVNYNAKSVERASRYTHVIKLYPNEIIERIRSGVFLDVEEIKQDAHDDTEEQIDSRDTEAPHVFYEQHRYWDIDDDGYKEPYIITVHKNSRKVVRIVARFDAKGISYNSKRQISRIKPIHYVTRYLFMPSPDGGFYGMGYGRLLTPINQSINITLNQIHDAGTLANTQSGFISKNASLQKGRGAGYVEFEMGEFKQINHTGDDIKKAVMPLPFKEPSMVMYHVLGLLIESGEKLGSTTDPMMGESPGSNVPATSTLSLVEQGMKVFSATYKRMHRAFGSEFKKLFWLNSIYLDDVEYFNVLDNQSAVARQDYNPSAVDICPVSDPNEISSTQKLLQAGALLQLRGTGLNDQEIVKRYLEALQVPDIEKLFDAPPPPPDPKFIVDMEKIKVQQGELEIASFKAQYEVAKMQAETIKALAQAKSEEVGPQVDVYLAQMKAITEQMRVRAEVAMMREKTAAEVRAIKEKSEAQSESIKEKGKAQAEAARMKPKNDTAGKK